ncbi:MMPL family transporter [Georgenia halophila]|uniref:MMPL family transporter n=1 Tax=Georgenia halophila TaxID=620889 RepID=UPI0031F1B24E
MFEVLGRLVARRPRFVVATWAVLAVLCGVTALTGLGGDGLFARLQAGAPAVAGSESAAGQEILDEQGPRSEQVTLAVENVDLDGGRQRWAALAEELDPVRADLVEADGVESVVSPFTFPEMLDDPAAEALVSTERDGFLVVVTLEAGASEEVHDTVVEILRDVPGALAPEAPGAGGVVGSGTLVADAIVGQMEEDLVTGEAVALPVALVIMVVVFGGFLAAGLPLLGSLVSIVGGLGILLGLSYVIDLDSVVVNVITLMSLALSIDYGLLVVSRYREELHRLGTPAVGGATADGAGGGRRRRGRGRDPVLLEAVRATIASAGRTVTFSALTVALAVTGLLLMRPEMLRAIAAAGIAAVLLAVACAVTLVPAVLVLLGDRMTRPSALSRVPGMRGLVRGLGDVSPRDGAFSRLARGVQRRPWLVMLGSFALLVLLASPVTGLSMRSSMAQMLPAGSEQREFTEVMSAEYPLARSPEIYAVAGTGTDDLDAWADEVADLPGVERVGEPAEAGDRQAGDHAVLPVFVSGGDASGEEAVAVVEDLRAMEPGFETWVTGQAAVQTDFNQALLDGLPLAGAVVVAAIFVLLFLMTGSLLVPLKGLLVNSLSLIASLGVTVWVFQEGHLSGLLGFDPVAGLESYVVAVVVAFGFGLAMDYEVFLLARIKEYWDAGAGNDAAVEHGLQRSGRIITSAAVIMIAVFGGFVAGDLVVIKQVGLALAVTVLVDATVVRMLLVPATMTLLGRWNWWAPAPLRRLYARLGVVH